MRSTLPVALCLLTALSLSSCSGDSEPADDSGPGTAAQGVEGDSTLGAVSPLTGQALVAVPERPVVTVKVDNSASSSPQVGLRDADLVTEELVEGGITRLAASYFATVPGDVGPVRSMRATDIGIVQPLGATLVSSGGAAQTVTRLADARIDRITEGGPGFYRRTDRSAPYNLFVKLDELADTLSGGDVPDPYLPFGDAADLPAGRPATGLTATFSGSSSTSFSYQGGGWVNTDSNAAEGDRFLPATVLVLRVQVGDAGYTDPAGNPVPETTFTGSGAAMLFHDGRVVRGTWVKDGLDATISLKQGEDDLVVPAGKVWIELVPADGGSVTVQR